MLGWVLLILGVIIVIALIFVFIKAAVKLAIRDIMDEIRLKQMEEEEKKKKQENN